MVFDDSGSREQWGWKHDHDIDGLVNIMFNKLNELYGPASN